MDAKKKKSNILPELLAAASPETLRDLLRQLAASQVEVRRECLEYLTIHVPRSPENRRTSDGEAVLLLWSELAPDLDELNEYGGGDDSMVDHVSGLLYEIQEKLGGKNIDSEYRQELLDEVLPYIDSGNAGLDDQLYDVAYACCYEDADWRRLAEAFERMKGEWKISRARVIYRKIGDCKKYLALRKLQMEFGADYHDLATFYWDGGEKEKAVAVAEQGLQKGQGRMDELRAFLADRAKESGDRKRHLDLHFTQTTDHLTLEKYIAFKELCSNAEWKAFEERLLERLDDAWHSEQLKIRMHRQEYERAITILIEGKYLIHAWDSGYELQAAKKLESYFPEEVLTFYMSGLGNLKAYAVRNEYARKAKVMDRIRFLIVGVLRQEERWLNFAREVKLANLKRPAFQEEFAAVIPGWRQIQ
ncbi:MAG: hypothetical protein ACLPX5_14785 [Dissulfurispiraceae bacterium]